MRRCEHLLGIDRRLHIARNRPIEGPSEGWAIGAVLLYLPGETATE